MAWRNGDYFNLKDEGYCCISQVVGSGAHKGNWKKYWAEHTGIVNILSGGNI